ncbi:hypothetical protein GA0061096_4426 [Fictibacillus enclensis]|uniref:Kinase n=1 Tax=Fictibacillus enclensis TaxID=1017270 RepID=A0A0V8IY75_9BACL|nr:DUF6236 family protein [Fictibacillus enclensis]KSU79751.1 hypothetical protein AS030_21095 [Fictibacillus enclensis]SCC39438.1 hypothetical protein GA0061096_4426 [Fictibacillus enclensis]
MSFKYLYYPSISLPNDNWLKKMLLYSEKIASIVPYDLINKKDYIIQQLEENNEYEMLSPERFFSESTNKNLFEEEVINLLSSKQFQLKMNRTVRTSEVYSSKFSHVIEEFFQQNGLDRIKGDKWYEIPKIVSDCYLGILAKHMAIDKSYIPATNYVTQERLIYGLKSKEDRKKVGELRLLNCLPVPTSDVSINEIISFKKERKEELLRFKSILRDYTTRVSQTETNYELEEVIQEFKEDIELNILLISRLLKEKKILFKFDSLKSLINLKDPVLFTLVGNIYSNLKELSPLVGTTVGGMIGLGCSYINYRYSINNEINNSPYSYVFHSGAMSKKGKFHKIFSTN